MKHATFYRTVSDAWFALLAEVVDHGYRQDIARGSFAKESFRLQLNFAACTIGRPLADYVPQVPDGVAPPTTAEYVENYFYDYILGAHEPSVNEQYTYASRIGSQLELVMDMLRDTPDTNQASIIVGHPLDVVMDDPACLRAIDFKHVAGALEITTFWRSHDLWAGFPSNLGAMAMLQAMVAEYAGMEPGAMHYASSGLHLYGYQFPSALAKLGRKSKA